MVRGSIRQNEREILLRMEVMEHRSANRRRGLVGTGGEVLGQRVEHAADICSIRMVGESSDYFRPVLYCADFAVALVSIT